MRKHLPTILAILFATIIFGLLIVNRTQIKPQLVAAVMRDYLPNGTTTYQQNTEFKNGESIHTQKGEFLEIYIGPSVIIALDENTNLELKSLLENDLQVKFGHGRILLSVDNDGTSIQVNTPTAQNRLTDAITTFIGYDFDQFTRVAPIEGSVQTIVPLLHKTIEITAPTDITSKNPPSLKPAPFDLTSDPRAAFYEWSK